MTRPLQRNSILCLALALALAWTFMFAKHDAALGPIIPFGVDPYDAVGSFAVFVAPVVAVIALVRAFRPAPAPPSPAARLYLIRAQETVVLVVLITLGSDAVAMARRPAAWIHAPARVELLALVAGLAVAAAVVQWLVLAPRRADAPARAPWPQAVLITLAATLALAFYPERFVAGVTTHLLTVVFADLILFAATRAVLLAVVPDAPPVAQPAAPAPRRRFGPAALWSAAAIAGAGFGMFALLGEMSEGGTPRTVRLLAVAAVFLGLAIAGVLIAFALLAGPLGFA
ncbi:MAG TPA: hypothetical protein VN607_04960 [Gemmatimonadaceae bacterium]|nr:hypothetical protein [Gemmatimonadaceae bacterium]